MGAPRPRSQAQPGYPSAGSKCTLLACLLVLLFLFNAFLLPFYASSSFYGALLSHNHRRSLAPLPAFLPLFLLFLPSPLPCLLVAGVCCSLWLL